MTAGSSDPTVLVVDDDAEVADVYAIRLRDHFDVETAYGGEAALERIDDDIDVVLLDRRMPGLSGDEVLERIRDRGDDCRVIMITAVDPDYDIVDLPFDDYITKPVEKRDLVTAIEQQVTASRYGDRLTEYLAVTSKLALLEAEKPEDELADSDEVAALRERAADLRDDLDETLAELDDTATAFGEIDRE